jgi:hypothetical protein
MRVAPVCRVGDPLQLTCTASVESGIKWNISRNNEQIGSDVLITIGSAYDQRTSITVNSVTFTFIRTSIQGALPLVSTLSINTVSIGLNGTVVRCTDLTVADPMLSAGTTIHIVDTGQSKKTMANICILYSCLRLRFPAVHSNIDGFSRALRD